MKNLSQFLNYIIMAFNKFWDFKNYDERTWFKSLVKSTYLTGLLYVSLHLLVNYLAPQYHYEYSVLNKEQMLFINRMYVDTDLTKKGKIPPAKPPLSDKSSLPKSAAGADMPVAQSKDTSKTDTAVKKEGKDLRQSGGKKQHGGTDTGKDEHKDQTQTANKNCDSCLNNGVVCYRVMDYVNNIFDHKLDSAQFEAVKSLLCNLKPGEAPSFLAATRFKVRSYFWLIGPCVYLEIIFWSILGVLSSLLFNLGLLGKDSTTDLGNPQTVFDASEIPFQVAKIVYAPICTLVVILGYNFFNDQNIVDISSSKGVIVFAFIGGFYSSRIIALMDRLKEVLLPNNGTSTVSGKSNTGGGALIALLTVRVTASRDALAPLGTIQMPANWLNAVSVTLKSNTTGAVVSGLRTNIDPEGEFTFKNVLPGNYTVSADYKQPVQTQQVHLAGMVTGMIGSSAAPIEVKLSLV